MAKQRKKNGVPKSIAGVKVPKRVRRGLKSLAASQEGRTVLTEALVAAGAALAAGGVTKKIKDKGGASAAAAAFRASALATAFGAATQAFADTLRGHTAPPQPPDPAAQAH